MRVNRRIIFAVTLTVTGTLSMDAHAEWWWRLDGKACQRNTRSYPYAPECPIPDTSLQPGDGLSGINVHYMLHFPPGTLVPHRYRSRMRVPVVRFCAFLWK
jgi:hypothetical protein